MKEAGVEKRSIRELGTLKRKGFSMLQEELIKTDFLYPDRSVPLVIQPALEGVNLMVWAASNKELVDRLLLKHGGLLFRNFDVYSVTQFEDFVRTVSGELLEYRERSSPRSQVSGNVYTATDYPADQGIFLHCENSYSHSWPLKIFFFCAGAPQKGGETLIADCRKVFQRIDPGVKQSFIDKKVMYVRNFSEGVGLPWQTVFQTTERSVAEDYCRKHGIDYEWRDGNRLRIKQVRPAVATHPTTGEMVWFNHATFFHISTLSQEIREAMLAEFNEEGLPNNTYYGDGSRIEPSVLDHLREAYNQETVHVCWQQGDILMLDNMLTPHGRMPFVGTRRVLVAMTEPFVSDC